MTTKNLDRFFKPQSIAVIGASSQLDKVGNIVLRNLLPPLNERLARQMIESLKCWPILQGYRGRPGVNIDLLINTLIRVSYLVADFPEIEELDVNPLLVTPDEAVALDARIVLASSGR